MNILHPDYNSPSALKAFLESKGMSMQKKFGQNFLINQNARAKLAESLEITENMTVWEVGPGLGALTEEILKRGAILTVFEIDRGFASVLKDFFSDYIQKGKLKIVEGDVLKNWKKTLEQDGIPQRFFGNLPYNIAATLIADTIEQNVRFDKAVFTVQKEVAERAMAKEGEKDYSSFSILCQWAYKLSSIADFPGSYFWPRPNVDSRAFKMVPNEIFPNCENPKLFMKMQRALFASRRKTIKNNLTTFLSNAQNAEIALQKANISPLARAETLPVKTLLLLSDIINTDIITSK